MFSTVAVGTDGSETAAEAVRQAADIARRYGAKLVLLSAYPGPQGFAAYAGIDLEWASSSQHYAGTVLERHKADLGEEGIECDTRSGQGDPGDVLVQLAEECGADLLVIGNKGMKRRVLGSVPKTVTHNADCTVMVVKTT